MHHEQQFVDRVIDILQQRPQDFSAKWFNGKTLDDSVEYKDKELLVSVSGHILKPIKPTMSANKLTIVKQLVSLIVQRDSQDILQRYQLD